MSLLRTTAATLVLSLLLVPAIARAAQRLDVHLHAVTTVTFSKSFDVPPDPVVVPPDYSVNPIDAEVLLEPIGSVAPASDEVLPQIPFVSPVQPLRAPPIGFIA
jgi:hypothetical protein